MPRSYKVSQVLKPGTVYLERLDGSPFQEPGMKTTEVLYMIDIFFLEKCLVAIPAYKVLSNK